MTLFCVCLSHCCSLPLRSLLFFQLCCIKQAHGWMSRKTGLSSCKVRLPRGRISQIKQVLKYSTFIKKTHLSQYIELLSWSSHSKWVICSRCFSLWPHYLFCITGKMNWTRGATFSVWWSMGWRKKRNSLASGRDGLRLLLLPMRHSGCVWMSLMRKIWFNFNFKTPPVPNPKQFP